MTVSHGNLKVEHGSDFIRPWLGPIDMMNMKQTTPTVGYSSRCHNLLKPATFCPIERL